MFLSLIFCSRSKKISASLRRKVWPRLRLVSFSEILTVLLRSIASLAAKSFASSKLTVCAFSLQFRLQFSVILGNNDKYNVNGYWIVVKYANGKSREPCKKLRWTRQCVYIYNDFWLRIPCFSAKKNIGDNNNEEMFWWLVSGLAPEIPEDLYHLIKKAVSIRKHLERNRKDKDSKFRLILVESRIHRLARYYKKTKKLPPVWK